MESITYRHIIWLVFGVLFIPIYITACVVSILKAHRNRKAIKARNKSRRIAQPLPETTTSPVDIIVNEVRVNRWHRRSSSITSAKLQNLLQNTGFMNSPDYRGYDFYYNEKFEVGKASLRQESREKDGKEGLEESVEAGDKMALENAKLSGTDRGGGEKINESLSKVIVPSDKSVCENSMHNTMNSRSQRYIEEKVKIGRYGRGFIEQVGGEENKSTVPSLGGVDNPGVHLHDESPYHYNSSEKWVRNRNGMLEMVSMRNDDKHHYYHHGHQRLPLHHNQRYIFHPAARSREELTDFPFSEMVKTAKLATLDSDDSTQYASVQDLRARKNNQEQQQHQTRRQHYLGKLEKEREKQRIVNRNRHIESRFHYNEESDSSLHSAVSSMEVALYGEGSSVLKALNKERRHPSHSHQSNYSDINARSGINRRNSYACALDENEVNLDFVPSRSRSVADLSSSRARGEGQSRQGHFRFDTHITGHQGRINDAFSYSTEQEFFFYL
ncbi:hypothetical protein PoB_002307900 [Plakobranchus ocellatus]|uniref:Uncharacterized protein n=1 Tax=Plakobranchus ocellatus TaxID=259542 RepID=A0AAV3ZQB5_9GAST|nr:hypothetical protein PoB_002307900 [Plakobranchus ocellatus]